MKVILADLVEELAAADAEPFGGLGAVAAAGQQGALDRPALDLGQQGAEREGLDAVAGGGDGRVGGSSASRCSGRIVRPRAAITARARAFSSCRTLPGQGRSWIVSEGLGGERKLAPAVPPFHALQDVLGQGRDVLGAVAKRRDDDPGDVEAVEQVFAESAGGDFFGQVAVRGRDDAAHRCARVSVPPTRSNSRCWRTRRILAWADSGSSPTSSRKMVPPAARSNRPGFWRSAPVKAPRSWPNSSLSTRPSGNAPQLTRMNGPSARLEWRWSASATSSLPVPLSPTIKTGASVAAARPIALKTSRIDGALADELGLGIGLVVGRVAWFLAGPRPQRLHLECQGALPQRPLQGQQDLVEVERLGQIVIGSPTDRLDRRGRAAEGGHDDHRQVGECRPELLRARPGRLGRAF